MDAMRTQFEGPLIELRIFMHGKSQEGMECGYRCKLIDTFGAKK